jgi:hypothetical protein
VLFGSQPINSFAKLRAVATTTTIAVARNPNQLIHISHIDTQYYSCYNVIIHGRGVIGDFFVPNDFDFSIGFESDGNGSDDEDTEYQSPKPMGH